MNSNTALIRKGGANVSSSKRLPWVGLLALAMAGFICILTESLPAGLLPQIAQDLGVSSLRLAEAFADAFRLHARYFRSM